MNTTRKQNTRTVEPHPHCTDRTRRHSHSHRPHRYSHPHPHPHPHAQVDWIEPGEDVPIDFIFVGTFSKKDVEKGGDLPEITFKGIKAISYPGGARFVELSPCELDSLSDECDAVSDEDRGALKSKSMAGLKSMQ